MDILSNFWERLREGSTLFAIGSLLSILAVLAPGIVSPSAPAQYEEVLEAVDTIVEQGDEVTEEAISRYNDLRGQVEEEVSWVIATGRALWNNLALVIAGLFSLLGITVPDFLRTGGLSFVTVPRMMEAHGIDPEDPLIVD